MFPMKATFPGLKPACAAKPGRTLPRKTSVIGTFPKLCSPYTFIPS